MKSYEVVDFICSQRSNRVITYTELVIILSNKRIDKQISEDAEYVDGYRFNQFDLTSTKPLVQHIRPTQLTLGDF